MKCYFGIAIIALVMLRAAQSVPLQGGDRPGKGVDKPPGNPVEPVKPGKGKDGVCESGVNRELLVRVAENAQSNGDYEEMAKCMKRLVKLDNQYNQLTTKERRMLEETYELWAASLFKKWKDARTSANQEETKANLLLVVNDVMSLLDETVIPSIGDNNVRMYTRLIPKSKEGRLKVIRSLPQKFRTRFLDDSIYLDMKVRYNSLDLMLNDDEL